MGEVVDLKPVSLAENLEFIQDMCRYRESILEEKAIRKKYRLAESDWEKMGDDDNLVRAIEAEAARRVKDGSCKKERAQQLVTAAPAVLGNIMNDSSQSAKHRIDSAKVLNDFAANGPEAATAGTRFLIQINMGADTLTFNKSIRPLEPGEIDPDDSGPDTDSMPHLAAIATKKPTENGGGCESI
jgi:hypothetical protein